MRIVHFLKYHLQGLLMRERTILISFKGMRVHRHRIAKNNRNDFYNWRDLNLGENLVIYGTNYRICDCDQFTRVEENLS